jgi:hypothetical protein
VLLQDKIYNETKVDHYEIIRLRCGSTPQPPHHYKFMIYTVTGVNDDFPPVGGFTSVPPGNRHDFCRKPFLAPVMYL